VSFSDPTSLSTIANFAAIGSYTLTLTADDGELTSSDTVEVTVEEAPPNLAPSVDAGADQTITLPSSATLGGTVTDDGLPSGTLVTTWSQSSGPGTVTFADASALSTTASFSAAGLYELELTASDGSLSSSDLMIVTVNPALVTVEVRVAASSDDAEQKTSSGSVSLSSSDLELTTESSVQIVGMRFAALAVPRAATIVNAYVQFKVDEAGSTATSLTVQAQAADNAPTFTTATGNISGRARTAAAVPWAPVAWPTVGAAGPDQRTPNLAAVVQEVVGRAGWASGNSLVILISGTGKRVAESYNGDKAGAPLLHVEYR
jgi:PKD repeat protein